MAASAKKLSFLAIFCSAACARLFGQDFYQTYARITGNQGFAQIFLGPFLALNTEK